MLRVLRAIVAGLHLIRQHGFTNLGISMTRENGVMFPMQMHSSRQRQNSSKQEISRPSNEQDRIDSALALMVTRIGHSMSPERINQWHSDLKDSSIEAIEWAFDTFGRMAKRLPSYSDISELLNTWQTTETPKRICEPECQERHGKGYGNDCILLFKKVIANGGKFEPRMLDELDQARGLVPEWRRA